MERDEVIDIIISGQTLVLCEQADATLSYWSNVKLPLFS